MKFLRVHNEHYFFELTEAEKELLTLVLRLYPVIPPAHQRLSKNSEKPDPAHQQLLDEALAEQRRENKKLVQAFLADSKRFVETSDSFRLNLSAAEIEWLLQVLNDVRVGNWILLGSPEEELPVVAPDDSNAPHAWAMELAGFFQSAFLRAFRGTPQASD